MKKILICSPKESLRESLKLILGNIYDLILTDSPEQCCDILTSAKIGTLLIDYTEGIPEVLSKISAQKNRPKTIAILNPRQDSLAKEAKQLGAAGYLTTPLKADEVLKICH